MKKLIGVAMLAGAAMAGSAGVASADVTGNVALTTDYVWRGLSQSDNDFAIQGGMDYSAGIFYAGAWASSVDFGSAVDASTELDIYGGVKPTLGPVSLDFGVVGYFYPGSSDAAGELDFYELKGGASIAPIESLTLGATVFWTDDFGTFQDTGLYGEVTAGYAITDAFALSAAYGNQDVENFGSYNTYRAGASYAIHGFGLGLTYSTTNGAEGFASSAASDDKFVFTISRAL